MFTVYSYIALILELYYNCCFK